MSKTHLPIFGLGQCSLDYIGSIAAYPPPDAKCEFSNLHCVGGGPVATAMVALSRWGKPCYFSGIVGDDAFGETIVACLQKEDVDTGGVVRRTGGQSQFAFVVAETAAARRTLFWQRPTGPPLESHELNREKLQECGMLYTDGFFTEASLLACVKAKEMGIPIVVDGGSPREGMLEMARMSDCFIASETFSRSISHDPRETCSRLSELGCPFVGVTLGSRGYMALVEGRWIVKEAYPAKTVDTTGCGDVFHAGVAYGILQGWDREVCLDLGAWAAASVSTHPGGRKGIPSRRELEERYRGNCLLISCHEASKNSGGRKEIHDR